MSRRERTQLAAALLALGEVPYEDAKLLTADQIISLYQFDHYPIRACDGGPYMPWNLRPLLIAAHRRKSRKIDQPAVAKDRRLAEKLQRHRARMQAKGKIA